MPRYIARSSAPLLSARERRSLFWWAAALPDMGDRAIHPSADKAEFNIFTDVANRTPITAAITIEMASFLATETIWEARGRVTRQYRANIFSDTNLIYGLETLAPMALLWGPNDNIRGKSVIPNRDNGNAAKASIKCNAKPTIITPMAHLIRHRIWQLDLAPCFEWVPSNRNISDLPTRQVYLPFPVRRYKKFKNLRALKTVILEDKQAISTGRPVPSHSRF